MKNIMSLFLMVSLALAAANANACPKGKKLAGGTGRHHKGGTCVSKSSTKKDRSVIGNYVEES